MRFGYVFHAMALLAFVSACNGQQDAREPGTNYFSQNNSGNQTPNIPTPTPADPAVKAREDAVDQLAIVNYKGDLQAMITESCGSCHSGASPKGGLDLSSYDNVKSKAAGLVSKIRTSAMPPNAKQLPTAARQKLAHLADLIDSWQKNPSQFAEDLATFKDLDYEKTVGPLIAQTCAKCHGGDAPSANLRLTTAEELETSLDKAIQVIQNGKMPPKMDDDRRGQIARMLEAWRDKGNP